MKIGVTVEFEMELADQEYTRDLHEALWYHINRPYTQEKITEVFGVVPMHVLKLDTDVRDAEGKCTGTGTTTLQE
jgi:hypothetical protein